MDYSPLEQAYREKLLELFKRVDPKKPEKGVRTLIQRARAKAANEGIAPERALEEIYRDAETRTLRRLELLSSCPLQKPPPDSGQS